jgi:DNA-binding winged helix-turn-helix (wHTH) protein/tetratricopeptide (TPR) repeat protein
MTKTVYRFGHFQLDPLARELRRDGQLQEMAASTLDCLVYLIEQRERPVSKEELVSAVWGRSEGSGSLVAQTIMRLRRQLDEAGDERGCIRTVPRLGYRWLPKTTEHVIAEATEMASSIGHDAAAAKPDRRRLLRLAVRPITVIALLMSMLIAGYVFWRSHRPAAWSTVLQPGHSTLVLPAEVKAPDEWSWLRFGLIELLSQQLRVAGIPVESGRTVLSVVDQAGKPSASSSASFALVVTPAATLNGGTWTVQLDAAGKGDRHWQAQSSSSDVLSAARMASDLLLVQMGVNAASNEPAGDASAQAYLLRVEATELAGHPEVERELLDKAPPAAQSLPELALAKANFHCHMGEPELCEQLLRKLLQQLPANEQPLLRGKVLTSFWYVYYRKRQFAQGEALLDEAIALLRGQKDMGALAMAYGARASLEIYDGKLDHAVADLGLAYVNYGVAGDTTRQVCAEQTMADIAMERGQYAQALAIVPHGYEQLQSMGARKYLAVPLQLLLMSQQALLLHADELRTTDRYWPFEQTNMQFSDRYVRHGLTIWRAIALADNGQTREAGILLRELTTQLDNNDEATLAAWSNALLAQIALAHDDLAEAQARASRAVELGALPRLDEDSDRVTEVAMNLVPIHVLQRAGATGELKRAVAAMQTWVEHLPRPSAWTDILLLRAKAAQAWSEGHRAEALGELKLALSRSEQLGVPELIVSVGQAYALACLENGSPEQAMAVIGRLSTWDELDWRVAWAQARVYRALGQTSAAEIALRKARVLAGDRPLPTEAAGIYF